MVNVAVKVDGKRPIGARARRIKEPRLVLVSSSGGQDCGVATEIVCENLEDLKDHCQPNAPGEILITSRVGRRHTNNLTIWHINDHTNI